MGGILPLVGCQHIEVSTSSTGSSETKQALHIGNVRSGQIRWIEDSTLHSGVPTAPHCADDDSPEF